MGQSWRAQWPLLLGVTMAWGGAVLGGEPPATPAAEWVKLADPPKDLAGREMAPGLDGAWVYVPEYKGFLLYGGYSPTFSNEGWLFDPEKREWKALWPDDSLARDETTARFRVRMPGEVVWSKDRPGPARNRGAAYDPDTKRVWLAGGWRWEGGPVDWGGDNLGVWTLDPRTNTFERAKYDDVPAGHTSLAYDSIHKYLVAAPQKREGEKKARTWILRGVPSVQTPDEGPRPGPHPGFVFNAKAGCFVYYTEYAETWTARLVIRQFQGPGAPPKDVLEGWRHVEWKEMKPDTAPAARRHAGMAYDAKRDLVVLTGGLHHNYGGGQPWGGGHTSATAFVTRGDFHGNQYNDTWTYSVETNTWTRVSAANPPPVTAFFKDLFAYDPVGDQCVLYEPTIGVWALKFK